MTLASQEAKRGGRVRGSVIVMKSEGAIHRSRHASAIREG